MGIARITEKISELTRKGDHHTPPCSVSVGMIQGGKEPNVIPDRAAIEGTIRSLNETDRQQTVERFNSTVKKICAKERLGVDINFLKHCPPVQNHPDLYHLFEKVGEELIIPEKRAYITEQSIGSEDFGNFTQLLPGLLIRLGMGSSSPQLHTSTFDFCDASLETGITILVGLAMKATETDFKIGLGK
jgi:metal-dependent amidase/aminoacylase/carboxypeptidase family protein